MSLPKQRNHFMCTSLVLFKVEDEMVQRYVNTLLVLDNEKITKSDLANINRAAISRISEENKIGMDDITDTVIFNIAPLGRMQEDKFLGSK